MRSSLVVILLAGCVPTDGLEHDAPFSAGDGQARVGPSGLRLAAGSHEVELAVVGGVASTPLRAPCPGGLDGACVRAEVGSVEAWWRVDGDALQGLYVVRDAVGDQALIDVATSGAQPWSLGVDGVAWRQGDGIATYRGLRAWDAAGRDLDARMWPTSQGFRIAVDAAGAVPPIVVDPYLAVGHDVAWVDRGGLRPSSTASVGDLDGDGDDELAVAWWREPWEAPDGEGMALHAGSPSGLDLTPSAQRWSEDVEAVLGGGLLTGPQGRRYVVTAPRDNGYFTELRFFRASSQPMALSQAASFVWPDPPDGRLHATADLGDFDGDGADDVAVLTWIVGQTPSSELNVYRGYTFPPVQGAPDATLALPTGVRDVVCPGDVNDDGYDDLLVSDDRFHGVSAYVGRVDLYLGGPQGLSPTPAWSVEGDVPSRKLGLASSRGDVNGDGVDDVVLFSSNYNDNGQNLAGAWVWYGGPAPFGPVADAVLLAPPTDPYWYPIALGGDVDGDGADELLVDGTSAGTRRTHVLRSQAGGWAPTPWFSVPGLVDGVGDFTGDGVGDLAVASSRNPDDGALRDAVRVVHGGAWLDRDDDGDGYVGVEDCAPDDPAVHPGAPEVWRDGRDDDCDGLDAELRIWPANVRIGAPATVRGRGAGDGSVVRVFASRAGTGAGACHPTAPGLCLGLVRTVEVARFTVQGDDPDWTVQTTPVRGVHARDHVWFQAVISAPNGTSAVSNVLDVEL